MTVVTLPPPQDVHLQPLEPAVRLVWRLQAGLGLGLVFLSVLAYDILNLFSESAFPPLVPSGVVLLLGLLYIFFRPSLRYKYWRYAVTEEALFAERGWFTQVRTVVPLRRIQHLDVAQNLIEREFDLARLVVHTAGMRNNTVVVPGLTVTHAEALRDAMRAYLANDPL